MKLSCGSSASFWALPATIRPLVRSSAWTLTCRRYASKGMWQLFNPIYE